MITATCFGSKGFEFKGYKSTIGIRNEGHPELEELRCLSKKCGSKQGCSGRYTSNEPVRAVGKNDVKSTFFTVGHNNPPCCIQSLISNEEICVTTATVLQHKALALDWCKPT